MRIRMDCVSVASLSCYSIFLPLMGLAGLVGQLHCDCSIQSLDVLSNEPDASCPVGLDLSLEKFDRPFHSARKSYVTRLAVNAFSGIWLCNEHVGLFEHDGNTPKPFLRHTYMQLDFPSSCHINETTIPKGGPGGVPARVLLLRHEAFSQRLRHLQQALDEHNFFMIA